MARGFLTGVVHGGLLGVVVLAALSLALPQPEPHGAPAAPPIPQDAPVPDPAPSAGSKPAVQPTPAAPPLVPDPSAGTGPAAGALDLPVGSEFARGADVAPILPLAAPASPRPRMSGPVVVSTPLVEPAPSPNTADNTRPEAAAPDRMPAQAMPSAGEAAPALELPAPAVPDARHLPTQAPQMAADAVQDSLPVRISDDAPAADVPTLLAPSLDLSLPPDLTDLRRLERN